MLSRFRLVAAHPLTWALVGGLLVYVIALLLTDSGTAGLLSAKDNADAANNGPGIWGLGGGGTSGAGKWFNDLIDKRPKSSGPDDPLLDSPEAEAEKEADLDRWDLFLDFLGLGEGPPGSTAGEIKAGQERMKEFIRDKPDKP